MRRLGLDVDIVDDDIYARTVNSFRQARVRLPTFEELADPERIPANITDELQSVNPDEPHPLNLFRVHWYNGADRRSRVDIPDHVVLGEELTGIEAPILLILGNRFPMIRAHKVLAAYGCLAPRLVTGQFDPASHRAIWPSTGNYCRGGVAISRILDCRGVAVLPEGMSEERFHWLEDWVKDPADIIRTIGTESNVKEIYDKCDELEKDPQNIVFNQFCEFGNHLAHFLCTGKAMSKVFRSVRESMPDLELAAFVSATGSAGTIGAGDALKELYSSRIAAVEALECPTMLYNGFGEHNIQGIGDKHIPLIHNVMNTDFITAISDHSTDSLNVMFNSEVGRAFLREERGVDAALVDTLGDFGLSSICNILASIKIAKKLNLGKNQAIATVATDGAELYSSELAKATGKLFGDSFKREHAAQAFEDHVLKLGTEHMLVPDLKDLDRIFNLGYFTWVEQRGVSLEEFEVRRDQDFWQELRDLVHCWDERIREFNRDTGVAGDT